MWPAGPGGAWCTPCLPREASWSFPSVSEPGAASVQDQQMGKRVPGLGGGCRTVLLCGWAEDSQAAQGHPCSLAQPPAALSHQVRSSVACPVRLL